MAPWGSRAALPVAISEVGVAAANGRLHVVGGTDERGEATRLHVAYDPSTDSWERLAPLPGAMHHVGLTEFKSNLFAVGGFQGNIHLGPQASTLMYDSRSDRWEELAPLPVARGSIAVAAAGEMIHALGGRTSEVVEVISPPGVPEVRAGIGTTRRHDVFDPASGTWIEAAPLPGPSRDHMGIAVVGVRIHVFGGRINDYTDMLDRHDVFDVTSGEWTQAEPLPRPRSAGAFAVRDDQIVYAGGECRPGGIPFSDNTFDDVDIYDSQLGAWVAAAPLPQGRHAFGGATIERMTYFAGGALLCGGGATVDLLVWAPDGELGEDNG